MTVYAYDVFLSHSTRDKTVADALVAALEAAGLRCWIAPRDIPSGVNFGPVIFDAIDASRLMVLILSAESNASRHVFREVARAVDKGVPVLPVQIEDVVPSRNLEYFISTDQRLDVTGAPLETGVPAVVARVRELLGEESEVRGRRTDAVEPIAPAEGGGGPLEIAATARWYERWRVTVCVLLFLCLTAVTAALPRLSGSGSGPTAATPAELPDCSAAAAAGDTTAMVRLALAYCAGPPEARDERLAAEWLRKARAAAPDGLPPGGVGLHVQEVRLSTRGVDADALARRFPDDPPGSPRRNPASWWNAGSDWRYVDRRLFSPPLPAGAAILGATIEPAAEPGAGSSATPGEGPFPVRCYADCRDAVRVRAGAPPEVSAGPLRLGSVNVLVVSYRSARVAGLQAAGVAGALVCLAGAVWCFYRRPLPPPGALASPALWAVATPVVFAVLVALKAGQRSLEDGLPAEEAVWEALRTRFWNHSTWAFAGHFLSILLLAGALRLRSRGRCGRFDARRDRRWAWAAAALIVWFVGFYVCGIYLAPDPGTFLTWKRSWLYWLQFAEGCVCLLVLTASALWVAVAFSLASSLAGDKRGRPAARGWVWGLLTAGAMAPVAVFALTICLDSLRAHWATGNLPAVLMSYTAAVGFAYILLTFHVTGKLLSR